MKFSAVSTSTEYVPPLWEIALSVLFILVGIAILTTLAAKVFRVGILMTGKKPTLVEIWRWIRYA